MKGPAEFPGAKTRKWDWRRKVNMSTDTIIVADDHPIFRDGMVRIIRRILPGTILEAADFPSLLRLIERAHVPELIILDLVFPGLDGANSVGYLRQECPSAAIIVVSMNDDPKTAHSMLAAGANGYISKAIAPEQLQAAVTDVLEGEVVLLLEAFPDAELERANVTFDLSPRHIDLLVRLGEGKSNKEIARDLDISPFTVRAHMSALFKKLGVSSRAGAAAFAAQHGLI